VEIENAGHPSGAFETTVVSQEEPDGYYNRTRIERQAAGCQSGGRGPASGADQVEELVTGARQISGGLMTEANAYPQRDRYQRQAEFRGYRNGTTPRRLTLGSGTVPLDVPRVRDVPPDQGLFESKILRKYQRRSDTIDETFMRLFIEGLATRDFEPALRLLAGSDAAKPSTISRLTQQFGRRTCLTTKI
jgi:hypothetical protein